MKLKPLILIIMTLGLLALALQGKAAEMPAGPHVITTGSSRVDAVPDIATIIIDVSASARNASDAKREIDSRVTQYFDLLLKNGIERKDIDAANLDTQPEYDYPKTGKTVLKGYRAVRRVQVTVRQLDRLNALLDGALQLGLNEVQSIKLEVADPTIYREQARKKAIENAIAQAHSLAAGFNAKLGSIYSIRYVPNYQPMAVGLMYKSSNAAAESNTDKTYQQQIIHFDDQVDAIFELKPSVGTLK